MYTLGAGTISEYKIPLVCIDLRKVFTCKSQMLKFIDTCRELCSYRCPSFSSLRAFLLAYHRHRCYHYRCRCCCYSSFSFLSFSSCLSFYLSSSPSFPSCLSFSFWVASNAKRWKTGKCCHVEATHPIRSIAEKKSLGCHWATAIFARSARS